MNRLFGSSNKAPPPSLNDAIGNTEQRVDAIEVKVRKLDAELTRYRDQLRRLGNGPAKVRPPFLTRPQKAEGANYGQNTVQQRAMRVLKQKKMYEQQIESLQQQTYNLESTNLATSNLSNTMLTLTAMERANKELRKQYGKVDVDRIERMQDEMEDLMDSAQEIQETLGRSYGVPDEVDEADLDAELALLGDEFEYEAAQAQSSAEGAIPSYLQDNTELPDFVDENPANTAHEEGPVKAA